MNRITHHAAVGIIVNPNQEILISKRPAHKLMGGFWEFPGGKVEPGETPEDALLRELREEVGIEVVELSPLMQSQHDYDEHSALLDVFVVEKFTGTAQSLEAQEIQWIKRTDFSNYKFLEANLEMIQVFLKRE